MVNEFEILKDVAGKLSANNIAYMLSGSTAMNYYVGRKIKYYRIYQEV
jgi:hypothetical protein